ncbi:MAG: acetate--CoA ligase family protein [Candidatus Marinimicrobia bacterium]|nr:acetate--CoA ligase family protein [Candidatus Neomarinimicrobiota bacterium]
MTTNSTPNIKALFQPESIAVIGASSSPNKIGYKILSNIVSSGYEGLIYPVNPKGGEILGCKVVTQLSDTETIPDVAVVAVPASLVFDVVKDCAHRGVKFATIISSGFSEVGNLEEERNIVKYARQYGMRILGPNIFGHYSAAVSLNATFGPKDIPTGNVAIITQSGALGVAMIGKTAVQKIGLSAIISVGNKADLDESELFDYLRDDPGTHAIFMYIEGIRNGGRLIESLKKTTRIKPVIVIKSGRSKRGAIAAASHTGSLAGSDEIFDAIMKQCGVLRAENIQEALDWCKYISTSPLPSGENTLIITNGGGVGVLATDACEKFQVSLYDDKQRLQHDYSAITHGFGSTKNPIDLTGDATVQEYTSALGTALNDENIHAVISLYCETAMMTSEGLIEMIHRQNLQYQNKNKPVIFTLFGGHVTEVAVQKLLEHRVPVYTEVYESISPLGALFRFYRYREKAEEMISDPGINVEQIQNIISTVRKDNRQFLLANEGQMLLQAIGMTGPKSKIAKSIGEAVQMANEIGYPVVMKVVSRDIIHKSDVGGVLLNLDNGDEVMDAYQTIIHNCKSYKRDAVIDGIEIVEQVPKGTEVIIGARQDENFGPVIMFGLGGIYVEVMKDVSFRALPVSSSEARLMVKEIRSFPLLLGVRGENRKDIDGIVDAIIKVGAVSRQFPEITDIEINPIMVYDKGSGVKAIDVRVLLSKSERND